MCAASNFIHKKNVLQESLFQEALRFRLLFPLFLHFEEGERNINCGCSLVSASDLWHPLSCPKYKGYFNTCHNEIMDLLAILIKDICPNANVQREQYLFPFKKRPQPHLLSNSHQNLSQSSQLTNSQSSNSSHNSVLSNSHSNPPSNISPSPSMNPYDASLSSQSSQISSSQSSLSTSPTLQSNSQQNSSSTLSFAPTVLSPASNDYKGDLRADIVVSYRVDNYFIDGSGCNPACNTYINRGSHKKPDAASSAREKEKIYKYGTYLKPECLKQFIPYAWELTGRLGGKANSFMSALCKLDNLGLESSEHIKWLRRKYMDEVSLITARNNAWVLSQARALGSQCGVF
jgi:hypothetical protein